MTPDLLKLVVPGFQVEGSGENHSGKNESRKQGVPVSAMLGTPAWALGLSHKQLYPALNLVNRQLILATGTPILDSSTALIRVSRETGAASRVTVPSKQVIS